MGFMLSKDELLYQQVRHRHGTIESLKSLCTEGASLEWVDTEGKTPLIVACMNPETYDFAKTLIELGANVNAYSPGHHAGSPLHHAAKSGQEKMVKLLLSHGANALVMNDDGQTALDVARVEGYIYVVWVIENHICLFSGWLQERYGRQYSRNVWVVIRPTGEPFKLELVIYSSSKDLEPRTIDLWKHSMKAPNFRRSSPSVVISFSNNSRIKLGTVNKNENRQLQRFCNACKGVPQVMHPTSSFEDQGSNVGPPAETALGDHELALVINASLQSGSLTGPTAPYTYIGSGSTISPGWTNPATQNNENALHNDKNKPKFHDVGTSSNTYSQCVTPAPITPSAPQLSDLLDEGPVCYPYVDSTPIHLSETRPAAEILTKAKNNNDSSCVICQDAPAEGACIPCGHMVACMSCLNEIHGKNWGCPVCRTKINEIVKIYV